MLYLLHYLCNIAVKPYIMDTHLNRYSNPQYCNVAFLKISFSSGAIPTYEPIGSVLIGRLGFREQGMHYIAMQLIRLGYI